MPTPDNRRILYLSPSRVESDWRCPRSRWWGHEWEDVGLAPKVSATELIYGNIAHEGLAKLAGGNPHPTPITDVAALARQRARSELIAPAGDARSRELSALAAAQLTAFDSFIWPRIVADYEVVAVEKEFQLVLWEGDDYRVIFRCKPDLILRRRDSHALWYLEYKTTSNTSPKWIQSWSKAVQLHTGCRAVATSLGEPVEGCIVQGLYKGYERDDRLNSPLIYGWKKEGVPGVLKTQYSPTYVARWSRFFITDEMPIEDWLRGMPADLLAEQFPQTPPIFSRDDLIDDFIRQQVHRSDTIHDAWWHLQRDPTEAEMRDILNETYPQKFNQCSPAWGSPCAFLHACWNPWIGKDPVGSGYYVRREPR